LGDNALARRSVLLLRGYRRAELAQGVLRGRRAVGPASLPRFLRRPFDSRAGAAPPGLITYLSPVPIVTISANGTEMALCACNLLIHLF